MAKVARKTKPKKPPRAPATRLGFQDDKALMTPGPVRDRLLAQMRAQGAKDVRLNAIYGQIKAEGYGRYDEAVNAIRAAGLTPQMTIMGTPSYSPQWDQSLSFKNTNPKLAGQFAAEVAKHFKGRVGRYAAWNEPNWGGFVSGADKQPVQAARRYRQLYRAMYAGIKGQDRGAQVLLGEMTAQPNAKLFLKTLLAGKPLHTAGFAYHPYDSPGVKMRNGRNTSGTWDIDTLGELQKTLAGYKRSGQLQTAKGQAAPLYLTEFGYQRGTMTPQAQLQKVARGFALAKQAHARQFLQYQLAPSVKPVSSVTPGVTTTDAYGNQSTGPGSVQRSTSWVWDTGIADAAGNIPTINQGFKLARKTRRVR